MTMAQMAGLAMAMAVAGGPEKPAGMKQEKRDPKDLARGQVVSVKSSKEAPLFTAYWVKGKAPQAGHDYDDCQTNCDPVRYTVTFGKNGRKECPLKVKASVQNCLKDPDKESCTAIKPTRTIVFDKGDFPYQVRFSPFGEPLKVGTEASSKQPIHPAAAVAWYKFTVDSDADACKGVEAVDPNVIVTN